MQKEIELGDFRFRNCEIVKCVGKKKDYYSNSDVFIYLFILIK